MELNPDNLSLDLDNKLYKEEVRKNKIYLFLVLFLFVCILALGMYCFTLESTYNDMVMQLNAMNKILANSVQLI